MNETYVTIQGRLVADPVAKKTQSDQPFCVFRIATSARRPKPGSPGEWEESPASFYNVSAFRALGANAAASLLRGQPVTVFGRQRINYFTRADGTSGVSVEIDARAIGHDLTWGTATFHKGTRPIEDPGERMSDSVVQAAMAALAGDERPLADPQSDPYIVEAGPGVAQQQEPAA